MITSVINKDIQITPIKNSRINQVDFSDIKFGKIYADHMFIADFKDGAWRDIRILPYQKLSLSPAVSAIHYGQSIFEGLKAYKNSKGEIHVFRPEENYHRLNRSAERMCIPTLPKEIFMDGLFALLRLDHQWVPSIPGTSLYIRPFIFATDEYIGIRPSDTYKFMIFTCPVGAYYSEPVRVKIESHYTRACEGGTGFAKAAGNYAGSLYPARLAQEKGYHQLVWTDAKEHKYIEESGTMNIMFVINDTIITPQAGATVLEGITRKSVLTLAKDWGYNIEERRVSVAEIIDAIEKGTLKEAFGTGTAATIAQIATIGYEEKDYTLPIANEESFSYKVLKTLQEIRYSSKEDDLYNWMVKVQ